MEQTRNEEANDDQARANGTDSDSAQAVEISTGDGGGTDREGLRRQRLVDFLRELVRENGKVEAAGVLGVNYRTLVRAAESGELTARMSDALERLLLVADDRGEGDRDRTLDELSGRIDRLERHMETLRTQVRNGLEDLWAAAEWKDGARDMEADAEQKRVGDGLDQGMADPVEAPPVAGLRQAKPGVERRPDPEIVTEELAEDDGEVYGAAWPLVDEWRRLRAGHPHQGRTLSWLATEERLLVLELAMLEEHGLTLPPETQPLRGFGRRGQTSWRRTALGDTRRALAKRKRLRWLRRILTLGLWRK